MGKKRNSKGQCKSQCLALEIDLLNSDKAHRLLLVEVVQCAALDAGAGDRHRLHDHHADERSSLDGRWL